MTDRLNLTTVAACRVAGIDRNRFNEHVTAANFSCAPGTTPGRARVFDPDDVLALRLFSDLLKDGYTGKRAGEIACEVALCAKLNPDEATISYVENYFPGGTACVTKNVPLPDQWDDVLFSGTDIRKVTTFRIGKMRKIIAHYTNEERNTIGPIDSPAADRIRDAKARFESGLISQEELNVALLAAIADDE